MTHWKKLRKYMKRDDEESIYFEVEKRIRYTFSNKDLLLQALTHRSYTNENKGILHNERLEFLGDAILQCITTEALLDLFPKENEGTLSMYRAILVKTTHLAQIAQTLKLIPYIKMSEGQRREFRRNESIDSILANVIESIIGSIYLDGGLEATVKFINSNILKDIELNLSNITLRDAKTVLQEYTQKNLNYTPIYVLLKEEGKDHKKTFTIGVQVNDVIVGEGEGSSKRIAERNAAEIALENLTSRN